MILTAHTHDALPEAVQVGKTLLIASGSHGKFLSRLDLDVRAWTVTGFRYKLIPLFADAIAPDAGDGGGDRQGARAVRGRARARGRPDRVAALPARHISTARSTT